MGNLELDNIKSFKISLLSADFNCRVLGNGRKRIIAFHGFAQDSMAYVNLIKNGLDYTIYSFDLPYHGSTDVKLNDYFLSIEDLLELTKKLIDKVGIQRFSIIAFSIGAKLAYPIIDKYAHMIDNIWLLAPDGIVQNFWYELATKNRALRLLFLQTMKSPGLILGGARLLKSVKILSPQLAALVINSIKTQQQRDRVYNTWTCLRKINYSHHDLINILGKGGIKVYLIIGKNDKIIPTPAIKNMKNELNNANIYTLSCSHHNLIKHFSDWIRQNQ